jgi:anthranilate phosphoribosyltransferase
MPYHRRVLRLAEGAPLAGNGGSCGDHAAERKSDMFKRHLSKIFSGRHLTESEMSEMMNAILTGGAGDAQIGAMMGALAGKGETFGELAGAAQAMRRRAQRVQVTASAVVDTCGTGGDGKNTFNISTTTAFVVAGCGVTVAKHGNRSVSSRCGSADLLECLGVNLEAEPEIVEEAIREIGIGFLFAPLFHGALRHAAGARREIGLRSIFNLLGPLTNPAGANCQLLGVYAPQLTEMIAAALELLGSRRAWVVCGHDGLDEISVCAPTRISELKDGRVITYDLSPEKFFGELADPRAVQGGAPPVNAQITRRVLAGESGPCRDVVVLNAAAAMVVAGAAADLEEGLQKATRAIDTGAAADKLEQLIQYCRESP